MRINEVFPSLCNRPELQVAVRKILKVREEKLGIPNSMVALYDIRNLVSKKLKIDISILDEIFAIPKVRRLIDARGDGDHIEVINDVEDEGDVKLDSHIELFIQELVPILHRTVRYELFLFMAVVFAFAVPLIVVVPPLGVELGSLRNVFVDLYRSATSRLLHFTSIL